MSISTIRPSDTHSTTGITKKGNYIYNEAGLLQKFEDIALPSNYPWIETLTVISNKPLAEFSPEDDLAREAEFYKSTLVGVKQALQMLDQANTPYKRPADYLAEMMKTDEHMAKIKSKLIAEKSRMNAVVERKLKVENKKFMKQTRAKVLEERSKSKRETSEKIKKWKANDKTEELDFEEPPLGKRPRESDGGDKDQNGSKKFKSNNRDKPQPNARRIAKNEKFGNGGKKRGAKRNDADSYLDDSGFSKFNRKDGKSGGFNKNKGGPGKAGAKKMMSKKRPGKTQRKKH